MTRAAHVLEAYHILTVQPHPDIQRTYRAQRPTRVEAASRASRHRAVSDALRNVKCIHRNEKIGEDKGELHWGRMLDIDNERQVERHHKSDMGMGQESTLKRSQVSAAPPSATVYEQL